MIVIEDEKVEADLRLLAELAGKPVEAVLRDVTAERLAAMTAFPPGADFEDDPEEAELDAIIAAAQRDEPVAPEEVEARLKYLREMGERTGPIARELGLTSDHSDLYDDDGLPD